MQYFVLILEIIGTVAFAISGAVVGLRKSMDCFGVCILGLTTACGGGLFRDVILGRLPPAMFSNGIYAFTALGVSVVVFTLAAMKIKTVHKHFLDLMLLVADSLGLGIFTVVGVSAVYAQGFGHNIFFTVFLGTITGVGGGLIRDMMAEETPYIFVKHIYACASIVGAAVCCLTWDLFGNNASMIIGCVTVIVIRFLAAHYHWSLPRIKYEEQNNH